MSVRNSLAAALLLIGGTAAASPWSEVPGPTSGPPRVIGPDGKVIGPQTGNLQSPQEPVRCEAERGDVSEIPARDVKGPTVR